MTEARRPLVAGNWKMNGLSASLAEVESLLQRLKYEPVPHADVMVCPPATLLTSVAATLNGREVLLGAQDCHPEPSGAHTGDIAAEMLAEAGAAAVIVGHSERRADHGEDDALVKAKAEAAHRAGMAAIVCIGETAAERRDGKTLDIVGTQLAGSLPEAATALNTIIAYEPVWAIGTGLTPTVGDVEEVHRFIRSELAQRLGQAEADGLRVLYGGSVKPTNAAELMAASDVDGALVGGASLAAKDFYGIISVYRA